MKIELTEQGLITLGHLAIENSTQDAWTTIALEWLEHHLKYIENKCDHVIVDARNEKIVSGYVCIKCHKIFAAADHEKESK